MTWSPGDGPGSPTSTTVSFGVADASVSWMQHAERELALQLGAARARDPYVGGHPSSGGEERGLPDPGPPFDQQRPAGARTNSGQKLLDRVQLTLPLHKRSRIHRRAIVR